MHEYQGWQARRKTPKDGSVLRVLPRDEEISAASLVVDLTVTNSGNAPTNIELELPDIFYSPYKKTYILAYDKVVISIVLARQSKETPAPLAGDYEIVLKPCGLPPIPLNITVTQ
ncbi:MAG: hypothetical protein H0V35_05845 [Nitrospira sp.]|nr:hypothetical protein [Nitrospira sp.]